jgi:ketosteroid isomerase-like protein
MTPNRRTVETYLEGFRRTDREQILSCLTDDVRWTIPGFFDVQGREGFERHVVDEGFTGHPEITVTRMIEAADVVVAEGSVRAPRTDGTVMNLVFCDVFEMRDAKICSLTSYLMELKTPSR